MNLSKALLNWLNYTQITNRNNILKEELLRIPLSEFIERSMQGKVIAEQRMDDDNTDKHFDFSYRVKQCNRIIRGFIEVKYVQDLTRGKVEQQRYFDDICRLAFKNAKGTDNILIVFGTKELFISNFERLIDKRKKETIVYNQPNTEIEPAGIYSEWLHFNVNDINTIDIKEYSSYYNIFTKRHNGRKLTKIKTELLTLQQDNDDYRSFVVGIWKVTRSK